MMKILGGVVAAITMTLTRASDSTCPSKCTATLDSSSWPCRYFGSNCKVPLNIHNASAAAEDVNVVVMSPYSGSLGDVMTMAEPLIAAAAQEIEDSNLLPGYRVNVYLADSKCTKQDATGNTIRVMSSGPTKHVLLGDSCSSACESINDALRVFNVLHVSPNCISTGLSDRDRYPHFVRMAPSFRFNVLASFQVMKIFRWKRVAVVHGPRSITVLAKDLFLDFVNSDLERGTYDWTILLVRQVSSVADARSALQEVRSRDARIIKAAVYEDIAAILFCQSFLLNMASPDYTWLGSAGWWNQNFLSVRSGTKDCPCSAEDLYKAGFGTICMDRGPMLNTPDVHGLSGRSMKDIYNDYSAECQAFANGKGTCNYGWSGYFYDGLWHIAAVLHTYLVEEGNSVSDLAKNYSRDRLFQISLMKDYFGLTGRVRQFNLIDPVTTPPSLGDRSGVILLRQITGLPPAEFSELGYWSESGVEWKADVVWSPEDASMKVSCANGTCDLSTAWVPADRTSQCAPGAVWENLLGCAPCPAGQYAEAGASECKSCDAGYFGNETGLPQCWPCPRGTSSKVLGAQSCAACLMGRSASTSGQTSCDKCEAGKYGESEGLHSCTECSSGRTTAFTGAENQSACSCKEGLRAVAEECQACTEGMRCKPLQPLMIEAGYFSEADLSVYRCYGNVLRCPGGDPGSTCAVGRSGIACAECISGWVDAGDGSCEPCGGSDALPFALLITGGIAAMILTYYVIDTQDKTKQSHAMLLCAMSISIAVTTVQQFGIVGMFTVSWEEPLRSLMEILRIFSFDIELLRFGCVVSTSPLSRFASKVVITAVCLFCFVIIHFINVALRRDFKGRQHSLTCALGTVFMIFYISLVSTIIAPLQCAQSPNDKMTVMDYQAVVCYETSEHIAMVSLAMVALTVPVGYFVYCIMIVRRFPGKMLKGDTMFLKSYAFLFFRYRAEAYWYGLNHMARSLALALTIIIPEIVWQILCVQLIMLAQLLLTSVINPWRVYHANVLDMAFSTGVMMLVSAAAFFVDDRESKEAIAWFGTCTALTIIFATPLVILYSVCKAMYLKGRKPFSYFLCHHKAGAGNFARLLKSRMKLDGRVSKVVFLDCDDLTDLDKIFDYVRCETDNLVICCSQDIFSRPWCLGEMVFAMRNHVPAVKVLLDDFGGYDEEFIVEFGSRGPDISCLASYGVGLAEVQDALRWASSLPSIKMPDRMSETAMAALIDSLVRNGGRTCKESINVSVAKASEAETAEVAVLADHCNSESMASALILVGFLRPFMAHSPQQMPFILCEGDEVPSSLRTLLLVCTSGFFQNRHVLHVLMCAAQRNLKYIPIIADDTFRFPSSEAQHQHTRTSVSFGMPIDDAQALAKVILSVFQAVAIVFQPQLYSSTEAVLTAKAEEIKNRLFEVKAKLPQLEWPQVMAELESLVDNSEDLAVMESLSEQSEELLLQNF